MAEESSSMVELSLDERTVVIDGHEQRKEVMYSRVIVASLKGNRDALGLPEAKLMVEGGDRANSCARISISSEVTGMCRWTLTRFPNGTWLSTCRCSTEKAGIIESTGHLK